VELIHPRHNVETVKECHTVADDRGDGGERAMLLRQVIGQALRRARRDQGRTLREVSDAARVSLGYLSEIERGLKEPSSELLVAITDALELGLDDLLVDCLARVRANAPAPAASPLEIDVPVVIAQALPPVPCTVPAGIGPLTPRGADQPPPVVAAA
jgi:transcriptional regulator with XRE-family HTH domain